MKNGKFLLLVSVLMSGGTMWAQTVEELKAAAMEQDMSTWTFSLTNNLKKIDGINYSLDPDNHVAEMEYFYNYDVAPEHLVIPETVVFNDQTYVVVSIGCYSSYSQSNTRRITLPATLRRIGKYGMASYPNVTEYDIPESVERIEGNAFYSRSNIHLFFHSAVPPTFTGDLYDGSTSITKKTTKIKATVPAASFREYHLTDYLENCCIIADDLSVSTVITGPVDNEELGYIVVSDLLPDKVRTYSDVNRLIVSEGTINTKDWAALREMPNLISLDLSGLSITEVPQGALENCWQIETVILPECVEYIYNRAFDDTGIDNFHFPDSLLAISGSYSFYNCDSLRSVVFNQKLRSIGSNSFQNCDSLHVVQFPENSLTSIGSYAFNRCDIYKLEIPGTVNAIPSNGFSSNPNLSQVIFNEGNVTIETDAFAYDSSLGAVEFPSSMKTVNSYAFYGCSSMEYAILNEGLQTLDQYSFGGCTKLTSIVLPSSLEFCLYYPFYDCNKLNSITCRALIPPTVRSNVPTYTAGNRKLYVPLWSFQEYMHTPGWLEYQDHLEIDKTILPENIVINKDFEFVLDENDNVENYVPNISMKTNTESIDDGFGHTRYERGNLTISSRSKMTIGDFSMYISPYAKYYADFSLFYYGYDYEYRQTEYNPNTLVVRGEMRAENQVLNLWLMNDVWQFVSFPFDVELDSIVPVDSKTQWVVRQYDGNERAQQNFNSTWKDVVPEYQNGAGSAVAGPQEEPRAILKAGKGYIMKCYNNSASTSTPVAFTVKPIKESLSRQYLFTSEDVTTQLEEFTGDEVLEQNRSWNLIGNPYPCFYDTRYMKTSAPFMVWNSYNKKYAAFSPIDDSYILTPGEAFFIQRPVDASEIAGQPIDPAGAEGKLVFREEGRQTYRNPNDLTVEEQQLNPAPARSGDMDKPRRVFNFTFTDGEITDRTRVVFNELASMGYETGRDAALFNAMDADVPEIWTSSQGVSYSINERPENDGTFYLSVKCPADGFYTIGLKTEAGEEVILEDLAEGRKANLGEGSYTFSAKNGTFESRFAVTVSAAGTTAVSTAVQEKSDAPAYNIAGQRTVTEDGIIIRNGVKTFDK